MYRTTDFIRRRQKDARVVVLEQMTRRHEARQAGMYANLARKKFEHQA